MDYFNRACFTVIDDVEAALGMGAMNFRAVLTKIIEEKKRVLVVGLGISGIESARYLSRLKIPVVCVEREDEAAYRSKSKFRDDLAQIEGPGVEVHFGMDGERVSALLPEVALCVLSPGVSLESAICGAIRRREIQIVSELELGIELSGLPAVVVTGSNGKSTTVSLIDQIFREAGFHSRLCGNVGTPVISGLSTEALTAEMDKKNSVLIVEASSYQIESCTVLKPKVGVFLNLSDNHLERHGTLERYFETKAKLFQHQDAADFAVLNGDDPQVRKLGGRLKSEIVYFSCEPLKKDQRHGASIEYDLSRSVDAVTVMIAGRQYKYDLHRAQLLGMHNRYDAAASILAAQILGVPCEGIQGAIEKFTPLEHRLELLGEFQQRVFINDSKSTTVAASVAAFQAVRESFPGKKITLMLGGLSKAGSWTPLMNSLDKERSALNPLICFGKDANILSSHCRASSLPVKVESTLKGGVLKAFSETAPGEIVLLSPGCASFDEFTDFEDRGNVFKSFVRESFTP